MKKTSLSVILILSLAFSLLSCTPAVSDGETGKTGSGAVRYLALARYPELPKDPDPELLEKDSNKYVELRSKYTDAVNELKGTGIDAKYRPAMETYTKRTSAQIFQDNAGKNVVYSPANLYLSLCMLTETTGGESRSEVLDLLGLASETDARDAGNALFRSLFLDGNSRILPANSVWLNEQWSYEEAPLNALASAYYASACSAPMGDPKTDAALQKWINENTGDLLKEAAGNLSLPASTVVALVSTLYFKDRWRPAFNDAATQKEDFTRVSGETVKADFMRTEKLGSPFFRSDEEGYTVASLPFESGTSMVVLLPDEGVSLQELAADGSVTEAFLKWNSGNGCPDGNVFWKVPKFDIDSDISVIDTMKHLGVTAVFDEARSDFSPLIGRKQSDERGPVVISQFEHAGRVAVDESGCEAAAFTFIAATNAGMPPQLPKVDMTMNRPFAFMITGADGLPLFIGLVYTL